MDIENFIKDFDREISELDNYIDLELEKERNKDLEKLNKLGTLFLPPTLISGIVGMNVGNFQTNFISFLFIITTLLISVVIAELIFIKKGDRVISKYIPFLDKISEKIQKIIGGVLIVVILLVSAIGIGDNNNSECNCIIKIKEQK
jgi:hypothetical protein